MLDDLVLALACPACAAGSPGAGSGSALVLGAMIAAPIVLVAVLVPTIAWIVRRGRG